MVDGPAVAGDDRLADMLWSTDPEIFSFIFGDGSTWRRLFPTEWRAAFGTQQDDETRVALLGDRPVGLVNCFAGTEMGPRFQETMARLLAALDPVAQLRMIAAYEAME